MSKVLIELEPTFASDDSLSRAFNFAKEQTVPSPQGIDAVVKAWCKIAKLALQTGKWMPLAPRIENVSRVVEVDESFYKSFGVKILEQAAMVRPYEKAATPISTVGEGAFEAWWKLYPARTAGGKPVKGSKRNARKLFFNTIPNDGAYLSLMNATRNYITIAGQYPKDAERFLKGGFWTEFIPKDITELPDATPSEIDTVDANELRNMMQRSREGK